jgi:hypothetical protein
MRPLLSRVQVAHLDALDRDDRRAVRLALLRTLERGVEDWSRASARGTSMSMRVRATSSLCTG